MQAQNDGGGVTGASNHRPFDVVGGALGFGDSTQVLRWQDRRIGRCRLAEPLCSIDPPERFGMLQSGAQHHGDIVTGPAVPNSQGPLNQREQHHLVPIQLV
jgi:hypothetical protein